MNLISYKGITPLIKENSFIAPGSYIIGDVSIGSETGIWFNCVVRGDVDKVSIGNRTNIQDGTVIHVTRGGHPTVIGDGVTVGHKVMLHACKLEDGCFVGMGAVLMDDSVVESGAMVAAGAILTPGKIVKKGQIWAGNPARYFRDLSEEEQNFIKISENNYVKHVYEYLDKK